jgi:MtfA peptidase
MPKTQHPITVTHGDTTFTITSAEEYYNLPDTLKGGPYLKHFLDSVFSVQETTINENEQLPNYPLFFAFFGVCFILFGLARSQYRKLKGMHVDMPDEPDTSSEIHPAYHEYKGRSLQFSKEELIFVCSKYNVFFKKLSEEQQIIFINRLKQFLSKKNFYIFSDKPYKEMPILISACAVQITFGLREYLLPHFKNIIIHPSEYIGHNPLRILIGNVQGDSITLSWKHFLYDYQHPADGKNVGLHEMAHALQVQFLFKQNNSIFSRHYSHYDKIYSQITSTEIQSQANPSPLFDAISLKNKDEFWATSLELFFERPEELQKKYPHLYESICTILNQQPY